MSYDLGSKSMDPKPSADDVSLLERLNALKPSTIQLERRKCVFGPYRWYSCGFADRKTEYHSERTRRTMLQLQACKNAF